MIIKAEGRSRRTLGASAIVMFSLFFSLLGWALVVLAVSFLPPFAIEASGATKVVLALAHVAVAAVLIPVFRATSTNARK